jgi:hypothetical protein
MSLAPPLPQTPVDPKVALIEQVVQLGLDQQQLTSILLDDREEWAWNNMYVYSGSDAVIRASLNARPALYNFHSVTNMWLIFCPIIIATFFIAGHVFRYMPVIRHRYLALRKEERLIATFHLVFVVAFAIKYVPQTIWTIHLLWGPSFAVQFNNNYKRLWACAISNALLYVAEGSCRSVIRRNYFLVAHHILYFVFFMVPVIRDSVWGMKLILLLDCCIVLSELPLYLALLTHRFVVSTRKVKAVTYTCLAWSAIVRIAELVILIAYFAGTLARMRRGGELQMWGWFLALAIPGGALVCMFSFGIFFWFLRKRDKNPLKYGPSRYGMDATYAEEDKMAGGHGAQGKIPAAVDA